MTNEDASVDVARSKLGRLRSRLERGIRQPSMEQLRRPSTLFKETHRRHKSIDQTVNLASLHLTPVRVRSRSSANSIDVSPDIERVSNFSSPARSIDTTDSRRLRRSRDISPTARSFTALESPTKSSLTFIAPVPRISVTSDDDVTSPQSYRTAEPSKLKRLRNRTMSLFFDHDQLAMSPQKATSNDSSLSTGDPTSPQRPKLNKAHSDGKKSTITHTKTSESMLVKQENDLLRKRSRTLGSLEGDLYHKRSGSIVRTIGSLVMPKGRGTPDTSSSISDSSDIGTVPHSLNPPTVDPSDTPETYVAKLAGFDAEASTIFSNDNSEFMRDCLRVYLSQNFDFTNQPLDIALRQFLLVCELPREAQQIDRVLECFSRRYYECNVTLWENEDQIYFLTFSLVMLHTDHFNTHNKRKMTKEEFVKNTRVDDPKQKINNAFLSKELLEYLYDNITLSKFIQKNQVQQVQPQPLYLLPKRMFSSNSSTNLEAMGPTRHSASQRSQSISSSTSQFFTQSVADPYYYMLTEQLTQLHLPLPPVRQHSPLENRLKHIFPDSYFHTTRDFLTDTNGIFLRFSKECSWLPGRTEIAFKDKGEIEHSPRCLLRVIKVAELYREATVVNSKFFTIGSTSRVVWKKCYGMLTLCGFFIFDHLTFMAASQRDKLLDGECLSESMIIDVLSETMLRSCTKMSINGLFACQSSDDNHESYHTFNIFSTNKKELFSTPTLSTMSQWIIAINYVASLDSCYVDYPVSLNHEIVPIRNISLVDKANKLISNIPTSRRKIQELLNVEGHLRIAAPLSSKTKDALLTYHQSLMVRLDWLWYEVERNQAYLAILRKELTILQGENRAVEKEEESLLEDSFINEESNQNHEKGKESGNSKLNVVTNVSDSDNDADEEAREADTYDIERRELEDLIEESTFVTSEQDSNGEEEVCNEDRDFLDSDDEDVFVDAQTHAS